MKLDNEELTNQRLTILNKIKDLMSDLDLLKENPEYIHNLKNLSGVFFRDKDIIYLLTNKSFKTDVEAAVLKIDEDLPTVMFQVLDDNIPVDGYSSDKDKIYAIDCFQEYISENLAIVLHELVHVDDRKKGITKPDDKSVNSNPWAYYNHPSEIRAYTQQSLFIAHNEIREAIVEGEIKTKKELLEFCKIYKQYKNIFTKAKEKNNFTYWKPETFKDYLNNLQYVIDVLAFQLPD